MRFKSLGLAALIAAGIPVMMASPASAQTWLQNTFNRVFAPNPYPDYVNYPTYPTYQTYPTYPTYPTYTTPTAYYPTAPVSTGINMNTAVSTGQITQAQHQAWVDSINARVARGELGLFDGNAILIRGYE